MADPSCGARAAAQQGRIADMRTNDHWITCPHCAGAGSSPADRGVFTDDEITEIGEPIVAEFRASAYDRWCRACVGTGKILASQRAAIDARSADERAGEADTAYGYPY
jgi:hypothetical protein